MRPDRIKLVDERVELKLGKDGYETVPDPALVAPPPTAPDRRPKSERMCMKAQKIEIVSDGTIGGTQVIVDGVKIGGLVRFEFVAQKGYNRVLAIATMKYDHEDIAEFGDTAGQEVKAESGSAKTITADVFRRE